ncbi:MAG: hypothetical protein AAF202_08265, partial [Pseudomonadota bacterium]
GVSGSLPSLEVSQGESCNLGELISEADKKADLVLDQNLVVGDSEQEEARQDKQASVPSVDEVREASL